MKKNIEINVMFIYAPGLYCKRAGNTDFLENDEKIIFTNGNKIVLADVNGIMPMNGA